MPLDQRDNWIDATLTFGQTTVLSVVVVTLVGVGCWVPYQVFWRLDLSGVLGWFLVPVFLFSIVAHEGLHAVGWAVLGGILWRDIRFGVHWRTLTPYAHCRVPMTAASYRFGIALPAVVLGLVPWVVGVATGHPGLFLFGMTLLVAAAGDLLILMMLGPVPKECLVIDHPAAVGCRVAPDAAISRLEARISGLRRAAGLLTSPGDRRACLWGKLAVVILLGCIMGQVAVSSDRTRLARGQKLTLEEYTAQFETHRAAMQKEPPPALALYLIFVVGLVSLFVVYEGAGRLAGAALSVVKDVWAARHAKQLDRSVPGPPTAGPDVPTAG